jgi:hypothetical protein
VTVLQSQRNCCPLTASALITFSGAGLAQSTACTSLSTLAITHPLRFRSRPHSVRKALDQHLPLPSAESPATPTGFRPLSSQSPAHTASPFQAVHNRRAHIESSVKRGGDISDFAEKRDSGTSSFLQRHRSRNLRDGLPVLSRSVVRLGCDPPGFDRVAFHRQFNAEVAEFFQNHLEN